MDIRFIVTDFFDSNVYLFERNGKKIMVDCGGTEDGMANILKSIDFWPDYLLLSHGHIDHILALPIFLNTRTKIFVHTSDAHYLRNPNYNLSPKLIGRDFKWFESVYDYGDLPKELGVEVIHTPGHTPGSVCFLIDKHLFSGDTLFCGGIGNTSFPGSNYAAEILSVQKLLTLSPDITVYPGHGSSTTIGQEQNTI